MLIRILALAVLATGCRTTTGFEDDSTVLNSPQEVEAGCDRWAREQAGTGLGWRGRYNAFYNQCLAEQNRPDGPIRNPEDSVFIVSINGRASCRLGQFPE